MKFERLADTQAIRKIESRFNNLISRTFLKGAVGVPGPQIFNSVKKAFSSKTYELQLDKIIDDVYIASVTYADSKTEELGISSPSGSAQASRTAGQASRVTAAGKDKPLPITEEAIKQTKALSGDAAESVTRWLKDNDLYTQHPDQLARQVKDLWGGERYKARRFAVTFTADLAENTAVHRYNDLGIPYLQFYAEIDEKTTPQCRQFHGTIIKTNSLDAQRYRPPLHHFCRSALLPTTSKVLDENQDLLIENRNFTQHYNQDFKPLSMKTDFEEVNRVLDDIGKFNEKYRIDQFILDEDIQLRLMKLNLSVVTKIPQPELTDFTGKPGPETPAFTAPADLRANISEISQALNEKEMEAARLVGQMEKAKDQALTDFINTPVDKEKLALAGKKLDDASRELNTAKAAYDKLISERKEAVRELLYIDHGTPRTELYTKVNGGKLSKERAKHAETSLNFINRVTTQEVRDLIPDLQIKEIGRGRASTNSNHIIKIGNRDFTDTLIHETGHNIEYSNPKIYESAKKTLAERTAGEAPESLRKLTGLNYRSTERTRKDKFIDPYVGKIYNSANTEVTSMGLQYLYNDPEMLATKDPELFDWIVNVLRGKYD